MAAALGIATQKSAAGFVYKPTNFETKELHSF